MLKDEMVAKSCDIHLCIKEKPWDFYPVNKMRNIAQCRIRTQWRFILDADEDQVFSHAAYKHALLKAVSQSSAGGDRDVYAVASFQWSDMDLGEAIKNTSQLLDYFDRGQVAAKHD